MLANNDLFLFNQKQKDINKNLNVIYSKKDKTKCQIIKKRKKKDPIENKIPKRKS